MKQKKSIFFKEDAKRLKWPELAAIFVVPFVMYACALPQPTETTVKPPLSTDVEQVRDPLTGRLYYVACNPCQAPTPKTLALPAPAPAVNPVSQAAPIDPVATTASTQSAITSSPVAVLQTAQADHIEPVAGGLKMDQAFESVKRIVPFSFAHAAIGPRARLAVNELVSLAKKSDKIWVRGRTDSVGSLESNRLIAKARAATVREEFISAGVPKSKISSTYSTDCFIASNDTEAGRRANRRVDVELVMPRAIARSLPPAVYAKAEISAPVLVSTSSLAGWHEKIESN